ncbi:ABC transporter permease [Nocardia sp. NPDC051052]|uniref:ABC transporter permease n=1 Tax=Nocardia sp. NPDC051052 TaxID=3364322 RepID=UPI00379A10C9
MSEAPVEPLNAPADYPPLRLAPHGIGRLRALGSRINTFALVELQKLRHDRTELVTRAVQPALWMLIFGTTFARLHTIPTGNMPYLDFLAPGIIAQSALFIAIFYGIMLIWDRDAGILNKLMATPTPRAALITGKCFAAGVRAVSQVLIIVVLSLIMGVHMTMNPLKLFAAVVAVLLGATFFACLSMTIAGLVVKRDRLMGIGQAITMPLFFASNALYPLDLMPTWLRAISHINPLSYEVDALRGLLIGGTYHLWTDLGVLVLATFLGIACASALLGRLTR